MKKTQLLGIGNALVDIEFEINENFLQTHAIQKGQMTLIDAPTYDRIFQTLSAEYTAKTRVSGGSAANSTVVFSQLGGKAGYCSRVANDEFGQFYAQDLNQQGVQSTLSYASDGVTGKCLVLITPDAERTMLTYLGATADLCVQDIDFSLFENTQWLFMEGYLVTTLQAFELAKEATKKAQQSNVKIALSFSDPVIVSIFHEQISELLELGVDLLFANEEEAITWSKKESIEEACQMLTKHCQKVAITLGEKGCVTYDRNSKKINHHKAEKIKVIDTNGAGDAFAGAFLYATIHNWDEQQAMRLGNKAASTIISQFGARSVSQKIEDCK